MVNGKILRASRRLPARTKHRQVSKVSLTKSDCWKSCPSAAGLWAIGRPRELFRISKSAGGACTTGQAFKAPCFATSAADHNNESHCRTERDNGPPLCAFGLGLAFRPLLERQDRPHSFRTDFGREQLPHSFRTSLGFRTRPHRISCVSLHKDARKRLQLQGKRRIKTSS
jgi:hypothetical protein